MVGLKQDEVDQGYTEKTYNYLRITMAVMVALLFVSVFIEVDAVGCWRTSISAYYYTPVRAIFVGTLIAIGAMLIVIKGRTSLEDTLLNLAGLLAPIVAIVPTSQNATCPSPLDATPVGQDFSPLTLANIDNNLTAMVIAGAIGLFLTLGLMLWKRQNTTTGQWVGLVVMAIAYFVVVGLYYGNEDGFVSNAHGAAAIVLFLFLIAAILAHVAQRWGDENNPFLPWYLAIAALMVLGVVVGVIADWRHKILHIEMWELGLFAVYWALQTWDYWDDGNRLATDGGDTSAT